MSKKGKKQSCDFFPDMIVHLRHPRGIYRHFIKFNKIIQKVDWTYTKIRLLILIFHVYYTGKTAQFT